MVNNMLAYWANFEFIAKSFQIGQQACLAKWSRAACSNDGYRPKGFKGIMAYPANIIFLQIRQVFPSLRKNVPKNGTRCSIFGIML